MSPALPTSGGVTDLEKLNIIFHLFIRLIILVQSRHDMIRSWSIEDLPGISLERAPTDLDLFQNEGRLKSKKLSLNWKLMVGFAYNPVERTVFS